tara:strand:+ start:39 stop:299 length:261 start_codon:yes stop_codon:yes gene_type:complete
MKEKNKKVVSTQEKSIKQGHENFKPIYPRCWKKTPNTPLTKNDLHNLKRLMLIYTLKGSKAKNGVYYNKYKNWKEKGQLCLKQLLQ